LSACLYFSRLWPFAQWHSEFSNFNIGIVINILNAAITEDFCGNVLIKSAD